MSGMRYALDQDRRVEATPGAKGDCPGCGAELVAKCGEKIVNHWAHKGRRHCDPWWEKETVWHRNWKNNFPLEWQEVSAIDETGERHIADVKCPGGRVVEFQHSYLNPAEARKRTAFYDNVIWVVDGLRRKTDWDDFSEAIRWGHTHQTNDGAIHELGPYSCRLVKEWLNLGRITAFDFGDDRLWLLRKFIPESRKVFGFWYPKAKLIQHLLQEEPIPNVIGGEPIPASHYRYRRRR